MMQGIGWVGVRTDRFEPMVSFVEDALGLPALDRRPDFSIHGLPGGEVFEVLGPSDREHEHFVTGPVPGFRVDDVDEAAARIRQAGGELVGTATRLEDGGGWQHFRAPDGFLYEVVTGSMPPRPSSGRGVAVSGLPWVGTATDRFDEMCAFVEEWLGVGPDMQEPGMKGYRLPGRAVIEVFGPGHHDFDFYRAESAGPAVAFLVDRLEEAWDRLVEAGAERVGQIDGTPEWGWAHVRLPDGNLYEILAPRSP